ncbi:MAG: alpha-L-fucosidase [Spirochaetales bacterium]|nr:alpha-L-fucosidase [Spirochaetales bacterium]
MSIRKTFNYTIVAFIMLCNVSCISGGFEITQDELIARFEGIEILPGVNAPKPSSKPSKSQLLQIDRKYGMFIHFGINTFHDLEWTDGTLSPATYTPTTIDAAQWVKSAKDAGMKYIILISKHHDGFVLWDCPMTDYGVAHSGNTTDVIAAVAGECEKQGIELGIYYSLWDRNRNSNVKDVSLDSAYNEYMLKQIEHLMTSYGNIVELWLDGGWVKENYRWPLFEIYEMVKKNQPECQIGVNWSIGLPDNLDFHPVLPSQQREGYPIRYFPSDFRLGDPFLPEESDPKIFTFNNQNYYMPFETTICLSDRWFYNSTDKGLKSVEELARLYKIATANDNILIINCPPGPSGLMREQDVQRLKELREYLKL